jgi:hypothetical protein
MAAAWVATGAIGMVALPLRHALVWVAMAVALVAGWPAEVSRDVKRMASLVAAVLVALALAASSSTVVHTLAVAVLVAAVAREHTGRDRRVLCVVALAVAVLGVFRLAYLAIPAMWLAAEAVGGWLGGFAGWLSGRPLAVGATFAGLDFLILMFGVYFGWLVATPRPRLRRALLAGAAIVVGHLAYLAILARAADLAAALPVAEPPAPQTRYAPPPWHWGDALRSLLPWNLPLVGAAIQLLVAGLLFRWTTWRTGDEDEPQTDTTSHVRPSPHVRRALFWAPVALGPIVVAVLGYCFVPPRLDGKTVVAFDAEGIDWSKPAHGRFGRAAGSGFGMLPVLVESLGGRFVRSNDLSQTDLAAADVLVVLPPSRPWPDDRLQRAWDFVRNGGSLLVVAEPWTHEAGWSSLFDDVLGPTAMRVRFDVAIPAAAYWEYALEASPHPAGVGLDDAHNRAGLGEAASIGISSPARPILVGRYAWSDPGSDALLTEKRRFDTGERLGDVILAAEQRLGRGTVVVVSGAAGFTSEGIPQGYEFVGRLLTYLAARPGTPHAAWRQVVGLFGCVAIVVLLAWRFSPQRLAVAGIVLALATAGVEWLSCANSKILPGSSDAGRSGVALIDGSHLEAYSGHPWNSDGIAGLELNLMRNGFLPLVVARLDEAQLRRAEILISIAPARQFSSSERQRIRDFMERGGVFVAMAGADQANALRPLLEERGIDLPVPYLSPSRPFREPVPIGRYPPLKSEEYYEVLRFVGRDGHASSMAFHARWPFECRLDDVEVQDYENRPAVAVVPVGRGKFVFLADTGFAMNKNLEDAEGEMVGGARENSAFWRWLLARMTDRPELLPPKPSEGKP